jgi:hypothetical protein
MRIVRALFASLIIPALVAGMMTRVALGQQNEASVPSLSVRPMGTGENDPNGGQWFLANIEPGETKQLSARLYNPADVAQTVKLFLADMRFDEQGSAQVSNTSTDVGTWGSFDNQLVTIAPKQTMVERFSITAPEGVDPGDHVGAVMVEHAPQGTGNVRAIKRVAVRLYVTLPGDARKDLEIDQVSSSKDSWFFPRELAVTVQLRNTGHVRLEPTVMVDGAPAKGPELLMSRSVERYTVTRPVRFWGGPVRLRIDAQSRSLGIAGPMRQVRVTVWVIPWHLLVLVLMGAGLVMGGRFLLRRRGGKYRAIQTDIRRIERLVSQQMQPTRTADRAADATDADAAIRAAIKQARRAGDEVTAVRLENALIGRAGSHGYSPGAGSDAPGAGSDAPGAETVAAGPREP